MGCREWTGFCMLACLFLAGNALTGSRCPIVHMDEVSYSDPAIRWVMGQGFTSSAWPGQVREDFWAGNVPLHSLLLVPWILCLGISPLAVRSLNYLLYLLAILCLWRGTIRLGWVDNHRIRLGMVWTMLCGYGVAFSYRSARPDGITILLSCLCFLSFSVKRDVWRWVSLCLIGSLLPWAGLQLLPYVVLVMAWVLVFMGRSRWVDVVSVLKGVLLGSLALIIFYHGFGQWEDFVASTLGQHSFAADRGKGVGWLRIRYLFGGLKDPSLILLLAGSLGLWIHVWRRGLIRVRDPFHFSMALCLTVPPALFLLGKFPIYYGWMVYLPLCVGWFSLLCSSRWDRLSRPLRRGILCLLALACLPGFPMVTIWTLLFRWQLRDHLRVERFVERYVDPEDWVYCDWAGYYAVRTRAEEVILPRYLKTIRPEEARKVSLLFVEPVHGRHVMEALGGDWRLEETSLEIKKRWTPPGFSYTLFLREYDLVAYSRNISLDAD